MLGLLRFKVHEFHLNRTHYLLLPKLNRIQMQKIASRLGMLGRVMWSSGLLSARLKQGTVHVDPTGLCWSLIDPSDVMLPIIPDVLSCPKAVVSPGWFRSRYFRTRSHSETTELAMLLRMESGSLWRCLRAGGYCALAPDEHMVATLLMRDCADNCKVLTDYPNASASVKVLGRRMYFQTDIVIHEAVSTLRSAGMKASRNSYLPSDATIRFGRAPQFNRREWSDLSDDLGEWCFFSAG